MPRKLAELFVVLANTTKQNWGDIEDLTKLKKGP